MNDRFSLDSNLFVYSFGSSEGAKIGRASELIRRAITTRKGIVSFQVVQEFFHVALRRFSKPITIAESEQYLATVFRSLVAVHSSQALYGEALQLCERHRLSWHDSLIVAAAIQGQCHTLYSENLQHGQRFGDVRIENPFL